MSDGAYDYLGESSDAENRAVRVVLRLMICARITTERIEQAIDLKAGNVPASIRASRSSATFMRDGAVATFHIAVDDFNAMMKRDLDYLYAEAEGRDHKVPRTYLDYVALGALATFGIRRDSSAPVLPGRPYQFASRVGDVAQHRIDESHTGRVGNAFRRRLRTDVAQVVWDHWVER